jgi:acyl-ACP thioesterase
MTLDKTLMPVPVGTPRCFERSWPLRVGDIDRSGRLRLDALRAISKT